MPLAIRLNGGGKASAIRRVGAPEFRILVTTSGSGMESLPSCVLNALLAPTARTVCCEMVGIRLAATETIEAALDKRPNLIDLRARLRFDRSRNSSGVTFQLKDQLVQP